MRMVAVLAACSQPPPPAAKKAPSPAGQQWAAVANGFIEDYLRAQPAVAGQVVRHEFDGQLPDLSAHGIKREIARLHDERDRIAVDPAALTPRERFDREYLLAVVDKDLFWLEKTRMPFTNRDFYQANIDPDMYLSRDYASLELRSDWLAKTAPGGAVDDQSHWHDFHDLFLSYGGPPIPLLRRELVSGAGPLP